LYFFVFFHSFTDCTLSFCIFFRSLDMPSKNKTANPPMYVVFPFCCWFCPPPQCCIFFAIWVCIFLYYFFVFLMITEVTGCSQHLTTQTWMSGCHNNIHPPANFQWIGPIPQPFTRSFGIYPSWHWSLNLRCFLTMTDTCIRSVAKAIAEASGHLVAGTVGLALKLGPKTVTCDILRLFSHVAQVREPK
jgi:hypothetical protein